MPNYALDCPPKRGIYIDIPEIDTILSTEIVNAPAYAQAETGSADNAFALFVGDSSNENQAAAGAKINGNQIVLKPYAPGYGLIPTQVNGNEAYWQIANTQITTQILPTGLKTTLYCGAEAVLTNLFFTVKLPENGTLEVLPCGEIAVKFGGVECGYLPKPIGWDANGLAIGVSFYLHPNITIGGVSYPLIQVCPVVLPEHVFPIALDPSYSLAYTDVTTLNCHNAYGWSNYATLKDGTGKSWSALAEFPARPIIVGRQNDATKIQIFSQDSTTPWIIFAEALANMRNGAIGSVSIYVSRMLDFLFSWFDSATNDTTYQRTIVDFGENIKSVSGATAVIVMEKTSDAYDGGIAERNDGLGATENAAFDLAGEYSTSGRFHIPVKDSAGNYYVAFITGSDSKLIFLKLSDWTYTKTAVATGSVLTSNEAGTVTLSDGTNAFCVINGSNSLYLYKQASWTGGSGSVARDIKITDLAAKSVAFYGHYIYCVNNENGHQILYAIDADALATLSGDKTIAQMRTAGMLKIIKSAEDAIHGTYDYTLDLDVFYYATAGYQVWGVGRMLEGEPYFLVPCAASAGGGQIGGMFALNCTGGLDLTVNGIWHNSANTGIFGDVTQASSSANSSINLVAGAKNKGWRTIAFYSARGTYLKWVDTQIDVTDPTITGENPAPDATGVNGDTDIYFEIDDDDAGADVATLTAAINGQAAITAGVFQGTYTGTIAAAGLGYNVTINPAATLSGLTYVTINVSDLAGNAMAEYEYSFTCGETTPPTIGDQDPAPNATGVAVGKSPLFSLHDGAGSGVNEATIQASVEGVAAITDGVFQAGFTGSIVAGSEQGELDVTINPAVNFSYGQVVNMIVDCDDNDGNSMTQAVYSFTTVVDSTAPAFTNLVPASGAGDVSPIAPIVFDATDAQSGVDLTSLDITISGVDAVINGVAQSGFTLSTSAITNGYTITITPSTPFLLSENVTVTLSCEDVYGNLSTLSYFFIIQVYELMMIMYENYLTTATITATNTASGYSTDAFKDNELNPVWLSSNKT